MTAITLELAAEMGLTADEFERVHVLLGRPPNFTELGVFSAMWSEHCSYKSSRRWLKTLPTEAPWVICGPGENAGVVDIGDEQALVFKMESHNHPSYIEPYQGAATGVGGILRDIFTMGARPFASLNCLRFGDPKHPKTQYLLGGVVAGIGEYGNCMGVPTVAGECTFDARYNGNILVNAMTIGVADSNRIFYARARGVDSPVVYVGSKTGRDGIHGATMASTSFDAGSDEKRPTVQVGDPFTEKLLLEACLELMSSDAITGIQDMGAAGLTSSAVEMAAKGEGGIELDLDQVPRREAGMSPYELMLSESQERMLMVLRPGTEAQARRVFDKWELDFAVIGHVTDTGRMVLKNQGNIVADMPIKPLAEGLSYDRPWSDPPTPTTLPPLPKVAPMEALCSLIASPDLCSRKWIWEQYDHTVMADTVLGPGGDAAVVRIHGTNKAVAVSTDCTPRYCEADPAKGGAQAVAECWRNLTSVGARPLAITDCLNFGNPEKPTVMGQFVRAIEGMSEACRALNFPVVSGNVSFYNETEESNIPPTPQIGGVGLLDDWRHGTNLALGPQCEQILLIGDGSGHLGQSLYARYLLGKDAGVPPSIDLKFERRNGDLVRKLIKAGFVTACHDISDGGLLVAIAEMCIAGRRGVNLDISDNPFELFGEDQGRYLISTTSDALNQVLDQSHVADVPVRSIGEVGGHTLTLNSANAISISELINMHGRWFSSYAATG
ncbi:MAG: phosphoribosylformylglycinamidine synthase subunit PurL [Alphaproteobacteria bacterium]